MSKPKESDVVIAKTVVGEVKNTLVRAGNGFRARVSHVCCGVTTALDFEQKCDKCGGVAPARSSYFSQRNNVVEIPRPVGYGGFEESAQP